MDGKTKIKVLVVDDSAFYRQSIISMLKAFPDIEVIGSVANGHEAMRFVLKEKPDVITLDLEMPEMDGFTFLRWLMRNAPIPVLVISSQSEAASVFKALELGAADFMAKPTKKASLEIMNLQAELRLKIGTIVKIPPEKMKVRIQAPSRFSGERMEAKVSRGSSYRNSVDLIAIGASTGGPPAIQAIITMIPKDFSTPIVIAQHMPPVFTHYFAERLDRISQLEVKEAEPGDMVGPGRVLIAPGGSHMVFERTGDCIFVRIQPPQKGDRYVPSIDSLMASSANVFGPKVLGVLLTGMGNDGKKGMRKIKEGGGITVAESEETAVIYGMPKEAIKDGVVDRILPLLSIPEFILSRVSLGEAVGEKS
ncbi:MAG TPA: chemotaxis response regulator protein-glutamate methylesterase [Nitrospiria bacterium]